MSEKDVAITKGGAFFEESQEALAVLNGKSLQELFSKLGQLKLIEIRKKERCVEYLGEFVPASGLTRAQIIKIIAVKQGLETVKKVSAEENSDMSEQIKILKAELKVQEEYTENLKRSNTEEVTALRDELSGVKSELETVNHKLTEATMYTAANVFENVLEFTRIAEGELPIKPKNHTKKTIARIKSFIMEEFEELEADGKIPWKVGDWYVDHIYYMINDACKMGHGEKLEKVWQLVQQANMRKFPDGVATKDERGKVLKPEGWKSNDDKVKKLYD